MNPFKEPPICTHHLKSAEDSKAGIDSEDAADFERF